MKLVQVSEHFGENLCVRKKLRIALRRNSLSDAEANFANFEIKITCLQFISDH